MPENLDEIESEEPETPELRREANLGDGSLSELGGDDADPLRKLLQQLYSNPDMLNELDDEGDEENEGEDLVPEGPLNIEDLVRSLESANNQELRAIGQKHRPYRDEYLSTNYTTIDENTSSEDFRRNVAEFVIWYDNKVSGSNLDEDAALQKAERMYKVGSGGDSLEKAYVEAKEEGDFNGVVNSICEGYVKKEELGKVRSILRENIGSNTERRESLVDHIMGEWDLSKDLKEGLMKNYKQLVDLYIRVRDRSRFVGAAIAYRFG